MTCTNVLKKNYGFFQCFQAAIYLKSFEFNMYMEKIENL